MRILLVCFLANLSFPFLGYGQIPEEVRLPQIKTVQLFMFGNQLGYPALELNSGDRMELHFDDMDANIKNYSYIFSCVIQIGRQPWPRHLIISVGLCNNA
jgi:hypothetical protein